MTPRPFIDNHLPPCEVQTHDDGALKCSLVEGQLSEPGGQQRTFVENTCEIPVFYFLVPKQTSYLYKARQWLRWARWKQPRRMKKSIHSPAPSPPCCGPHPGRSTKISSRRLWTKSGSEACRWWVGGNFVSTHAQPILENTAKFKTLGKVSKSCKGKREAPNAYERADLTTWLPCDRARTPPKCFQDRTLSALNSLKPASLTLEFLSLFPSL